jgi:glutamate-5-semialdehyde dehydrogenase
VIGKGAESAGIPEGAIQLIDSTDRESTTILMKMNDYLDVLIPRGGKGLKKAIQENATVPVIMTGMGVCHVFIDSSADLSMAVDIAVNAKVSRPSTCNSAETLLIHKDCAERLLPAIAEELKNNGVELRGDERSRSIFPDMQEATELDWSTEYLDLIMSIKVVEDLDEAVTHINTYGTGHSEAIVTDNYRSSQRFLQEVDAAAVYVNASTRFTDGGEFGFGAEMGISTQKLHARGPMGLEQLTSIKYTIRGNGQIR